jgi:hypothetical protein
LGDVEELACQIEDLSEFHRLAVILLRPARHSGSGHPFHIGVAPRIGCTGITGGMVGIIIPICAVTADGCACAAPSAGFICTAMVSYWLIVIKRSATRRGRVFGVRYPTDLASAPIG